MEAFEGADSPGPGRHDIGWLLQGDDEDGGGLVTGARVAVSGGRVEIDGVARAQLVKNFSVLYTEGAAHDVEKLEAAMLVEVGVRTFPWLELCQVGVELAVGDQVAEAFEEIIRILGAGLREAHAIFGTMDTEDSLGCGTEEVVEIFTEDHCDPREISKGRDDSTGFKLGKEAGGEAGVLAKFDQTHRRILAKSSDAAANVLACDQGLNGIATDLDVRGIVQRWARLIIRE